MKKCVATLPALKRLRPNTRTLCLIVGLALLALMVWAADPATLWQYALRMRWCLPAVVAVWGVGYYLNAWSWRTVIGTNPMLQPLPFARLYRFTVTGFAINYITPFGLLGGEPYRIVELRPYLGLERASGSVILYMMMHVTSHLILWLTGCLLVAITLPGLSATSIVGLWVVVGVCLTVLALFLRGYRRGLILRVVRALSHLPLIGRRLRRLTSENVARLRSVDDNITDLLSHHPRAFARSLSLEYASRIVNCAEYFLLLNYMGCPVSYAGAVILVAGSSLLANLLFFSPLQLGTREGGILLAMQLLYPAQSLTELMPLAVAVSLMTRVREFIWIAIGLLFLRRQNKTA